MKTRDRATVLSLLQEPTPDTLDRAAKDREAVRFLHVKARELKATYNDPAYKFMTEILAERRPELEAAWSEGTDEDFLAALRKWTAAGLKALRVGIESEDEVMERRGEIVSEGQMFRMTGEARDSEARRA